MSESVWVKLGLAASFAFYTGLVIIQAEYRFFEGDIAGFWSIGRIAHERGYSQIYDPQVLAEYQNPNNPADIVPASFAAIFIIPFQILALLPFDTAAWLWRFINLTVCFIYCVFFASQINLPANKKPALLAIMLSLPVYVNFAWGQINLLPMLGIGEFLRLGLNKKMMLAGAALGLLLVKPQILILLLPVLFFQREWQKLAGFIVSAAGVSLASLALAGFNGMKQLFDLWLKYSAGMPTNEPQHMINWRMAGIQIGALTNARFGYAFAVAGILLTAIFSAALWRKHSPTSFYGMLNILAATFLISWHTHLHYMIILLPPLIGIAAQDDGAEKFIYNWVFSGVLFYFVILLLDALASLPSGFAATLSGVWGFASGMIFLNWSSKKMGRTGRIT